MKKFFSKVKSCEGRVMSYACRVVVAMLLLFGGAPLSFVMAADQSAGAQAFSTATEEIKSYLPLVQDLCYALAGVVIVVGAVSVFMKMNNEEQDVKKSIMLIIGSCVFLIAAAQALPLFFGM